MVGGTCTILLAPNGAGKSSELRRISNGATKRLKFLSPNRNIGAARFGLVSQAVDRPSISNRVSSLLETPLVLGGVSLQDARKQAHQVLSRFGFGYLYERTLSGLSGGEDQVVHLLAGITQDRPGLIVDDPFGMLDGARSIEVQRLLKQYGEGQETDGPRELVIGLPDSDVALVSELKNSNQDTLSVQVPDNQDRNVRLSEFVAALFRESPPLTAKSSVIFDNVKLTLRGKKGTERDLARLSSSMTTGRLHVLTGENGCGKSLLLNAIVGKMPKIARFSAGALVTEGFRHFGRVGRFDRGRLLTSAVIFVPQHCNKLLLATTPWEALTRVLGNQNSGLVDRARGLLESGILWENRQATDASVGQTRFVTVFLAAISALIRPEIRWLIADEPDAYLDSSLQNNLATILGRVAAAGKGVVITSHRKALYSGAAEIPLIQDRNEA